VYNNHTSSFEVSAFISRTAYICTTFKAAEASQTNANLSNCNCTMVVYPGTGMDAAHATTAVIA